jgi:hypothetical protein
VTLRLLHIVRVNVLSNSATRSAIVLEQEAR